MKKNKANCEEIIYAGFGGQGIMFAGKLLAHAALLDGKKVTWMPSYGAEVRGGTAHSKIKISEEYIASPVVIKPTACVALNGPSALRYENAIIPGGTLIINKSLVQTMPKRKDIDVIALSMTDIAQSAGNVKAANLVGLGALVRKTGVVSKRSIFEALAESLKGKEELYQVNKKAFEKGYESVRS